VVYLFFDRVGGYFRRSTSRSAVESGKPAERPV
jgi:hypothetical protein